MVRKSQQLNSNTTNISVYVKAFYYSILSFMLGINILGLGPFGDHYNKMNSSIFSEDQSPLIKTLVFGIINGMMPIGALVSSFYAASLRQLIGISYMVIKADIFFALGWFGLFMFKNNHIVSLISRFISGIGVGITSYCLPLILLSLSTKQTRGVVSLFHQFGIVLGIFVSAVTFTAIATMKMWEYCFVACFLLCLLHLLTFSLFYATGHRIKFQEEKKEEPEPVNDEITQDFEIKSQTNQTPPPRQKIKKIGLFKLFSKKEASRSLFVGSISHITQQLTGINAILGYTDTIFEKVFPSTALKPLAPLLINTANIIGCVISLFIIDHLGRKVLMLSSKVGCIIGLLSFFFLQKFWVVSDPSNAAVNTIPNYFSIGMTCFYVVFFALGLGPVPWILNTEIFPPESVDAGSSFLVSVNWFLCFLVVAFFPFLNSLMGIYSFLIFVGFQVLFLILFAVSFIETKNQPVQYQGTPNVSI